MKPTRRSLYWLLFFELSVAGCAWILYDLGRLVPAGSFLAFAIGLLLWQFALQFRDRRTGESLQIQSSVVLPHYIQIGIQLAIYLYWAGYWDAVTNWVLLIVGQLLLSYAIQGLLAWSRRRPWRFGFGPFPIVLSINLFFWFREDYFYLQLLMIACTQLSKEFITWTRGDRITHIFNPSGIVLSVTGLLLMLTNRFDLAVGVDLINSFYIAPNFFEVLFLLGLIVQFLFHTTLTTFGAALSLSAVYYVFKLAGYPLQTPFDVSVLIGMTLLVTDPSTSPRSKLGKFLFGLTYGALVFVTYVILRYLQQPSFFDKIFPVLVVNLLVVQFDHLANAITSRVDRYPRVTAILGNPYAHIATYSILFVAILPTLKVRDSNVPDPFPPQLMKSSPEVQELLAGAIAVDIAYPEARKPFGLYAEFVHFDEHRRLRQDTVEANMRLARGLILLGEIDMAIEKLERVLELEPRLSVELSPKIRELRSIQSQ
jgi:hypothetical protein